MPIEGHAAGVDGPSWPATWIYDAPFWAPEVLRPGNPREDPYNSPFMDRPGAGQQFREEGQLGATAIETRRLPVQSPVDSQWKDAIEHARWKDALSMRRTRVFSGPVAHATEEIAVIDGMGIAGIEMGEWAGLDAISTACRNHITVFNTAWGLCTLPPASIIPGTPSCREIAKGGLRASASSIGGECPAAAQAAINAVMGVVPPPAPPAPAPDGDKMSETTKTILTVGAGAVGVGLLIWLLK